MSHNDPLPSFGAPPLNEVVVGVQFASLPNYDFRFVSEAYKAFRSDYPHAAEQPYLPPQYEVFGGSLPAMQNRIEFGPAPVQNRTWFTSVDNDHLLQLQSDRFMLNWRAAGVGSSASYPRFEPILSRFLDGFETIEEISSRTLGAHVELTQAELAYINLIPLADFFDATNWIACLDDYPSDGLESISLATSKVLHVDNNRPVARLHTQLQTVYFGAHGDKKGLHLTLTVRGAISGVGSKLLEDFLKDARGIIVNEFALITSEMAHVVWKRST